MLDLYKGEREKLYEYFYLVYTGVCDNSDPDRKKQVSDLHHKMTRLYKAPRELAVMEGLLLSIKSWLEDDGFVDAPECDFF